MPLTVVRPPVGAWEEHAIRSLADGVGANAWARRAQLVIAAWRGDSVTSIASKAGLTPHTVKAGEGKLVICERCAAVSIWDGTKYRTLLARE